MGNFLFQCSWGLATKSIEKLEEPKGFPLQAQVSLWDLSKVPPTYVFLYDLGDDDIAVCHRKRIETNGDAQILEQSPI
jgi:hypothetical protein